MATPLGHVLAGATAGALCRPAGDLRRRLVAGGLLGGAADLDFIPGILIGDPARYHHLYTHSLVAALIAGLLLTVALGGRRLYWGVLGATAYASHLLLDYVTYDPSPPQGIPLLWPLVDTAFASPISVLPQVLHTSVSVVNAHNFLVACAELLIFGSFFAIALKSTVRNVQDRV